MDLLGQRVPHRGSPIQPARLRRLEIPDFHAVDIDRLSERHIRVAIAINAGREYMDVVTAGRKGATQAVHRHDRSTITTRGKIGRRDVQDPQAMAGTLGDIRRLMPHHATSA